jgi:hypothetical protein
VLDLREAWDGESERSAPQSGSNLAGKGDGRCLNRNGDRRTVVSDVFPGWHRHESHADANPFQPT